MDEFQEHTEPPNPDDPVPRPPIISPADDTDANPVFNPAWRLSTGRAVLELLIVITALLIPLIIRRFIFGLEPVTIGQRLGKNVYWAVVVNGTPVTLVVFLLLWIDGHPWRSVGLYLKKMTNTIIAAGAALFVIYVLQFLLVLLLAIFWPEMWKKFYQDRRELTQMFPRISLPGLVLFTLFVGFYEELLFRGFLITRLRFVVKNVWVALIAAGVLFGVIHDYQDPFAQIQIVVVAVVLGALFIIRQNLIAPILVHAAFDFISLFMSIYGQEYLSELK